MARRQWHLQQDATGVTLARHWPPRFDVCGRATFALPPAPVSSAFLVRVGHQVRQDLWRALRRQRGFSPVVVLTPVDGHLEILAGGRAARPIPPDTSMRIVSLLTDPSLIERWIRWAKQGKAL